MSMLQFVVWLIATITFVASIKALPYETAAQRRKRAAQPYRLFGPQNQHMAWIAVSIISFVVGAVIFISGTVSTLGNVFGGTRGSDTVTAPQASDVRLGRAPSKSTEKRPGSKKVVVAQRHPVMLGPDGGDNSTTGLVCDSISSLKASADSGTDSAPGCVFKRIGPVVFDKIVGHEQYGDTIMYVAAIHSMSNTWSGYVEANRLSGLPANVITVAEATATPAAENNVTVFKLTDGVNAYYNIDRCQDLFNAMEDEGALARVRAAHDAGEYADMSEGEKVVVTSGDLDKDIFVMVDDPSNSSHGCVPSAKLERVP